MKRILMLSSRNPVGRDFQLFRRGSKHYDWLYKYYERKEAEKELKHHQETTELMPPAEGPREKVFLEFEAEGEKLGRITCELASDLLPITSENFINLLTGKGLPSATGKVQCYKGSIVHQIMKQQFVVMGDISFGNGRGGYSSFGKQHFDDEGYFFRHSKPGVIGMANSGVHRNSSVFYITMKPAPWLDGRNVPFGRVLEGLDVVRKMEEQFSIKGLPVSPITISNCGVLEDDGVTIKEKAKSEEDQAESGNNRQEEEQEESEKKEASSTT